ncbi:ArsA family ATPase [Actinopolyspora mortivallis]|uniref:Arsenic-transporting ATPase n=1 Tax=Actinopolyspora mortivallis TaxID=33906 RepID=A0A2T0H0V5_ACTMO|nr:ArsA family ATPase [Actinopolyspora mortivallis]PRW65004.1 arsenic-transporting ATPase [Actinopolyspora mortivallis]
MRTLMFTGKGGVGKTTLAAATAVRLAERGGKILVLSTDPAHSLADCLGTGLDHEPRELSLSSGQGEWSETDVVLHAAEIATRGLLEEVWGRLREHLHTLLTSSGVAEVDAAELTGLPGVEELLALTEVRRLASEGPWDTVVVDCGPTAETLRLLTLPEALDDYLERLFPKHRRLVRGMLAGMAGDSHGDRWDALSEALGGLAARLEGLTGFLTDRTTSVRLVSTPESVVAAETRRVLTALSLHRIHVDGVLVNRMVPSPGEEEGAAAEWLRLRRGQQRGVVAELEGLGLPLRSVEHRASEPVGAAALRELGAGIYGAADPLEGAERRPVIDVRETPEHERARYWLRVALPLGPSTDPELTRVGDELAITVNGHRRLVALPSVLRRCVVVEAEAGDDGLAVGFRPDPEQWMR